MRKLIKSDARLKREECATVREKKQVFDKMKKANAELRKLPELKGKRLLITDAAISRRKKEAIKEVHEKYNRIRNHAKDLRRAENA